MTILAFCPNCGALKVTDTAGVPIWLHTQDEHTNAQLLASGVPAEACGRCPAQFQPVATHLPQLTPQKL